MMLSSHTETLISIGRRAMIGLVMAGVLAGAIGCLDLSSDDGWESRLYSPTLLTKIGDDYFIVDAWHNRILYNQTLDRDLSAWSVLDQDLAGPHSIASNGRILVVDDTGFHRVAVYEIDGDGYSFSHYIPRLGRRPHRVVYDEATEAFYVIASRSQTMYKLRDTGQTLVVEREHPLDFLDGAYTRSFSIIDGSMYFVSGPGKIFRVRYDDDSFAVLDSYKVPSTFRQMNDLVKVGGAYYLTNTHDWVTEEDLPENTIHRCEELEDFGSGGCEDVKEELELQGIPYYISHIDGRYYIAMANQYNGIAIADVDDQGRLVAGGRLFDSGPPTEGSFKERFRLPK